MTRTELRPNSKDAAKAPTTPHRRVYYARYGAALHQFFVVILFPGAWWMRGVLCSVPPHRNSHRSRRIKSPPRVLGCRPRRLAIKRLSWVRVLTPGNPRPLRHPSRCPRRHLSRRTCVSWFARSRDPELYHHKSRRETRDEARR